MVKRSSFMTPLSLSLFLLLIIIAALQLEASVPMKTFHYVDEKKTWSDARQYCKEKFTDLASYPGKDLLDFFKHHHRDERAWIGLYRDPGNLFVWRWTGERRRDATSDTNWARGEPEMKNCTCVIRSDGKWYNRKCSERHHFDCSKGQRVAHTLRDVTWYDAQRSCEKQSMVLATVTRSNKKSFTHGWIGLHMPQPTANAASGTPPNSTWQWMGPDSDFRDWAKGQPDLNGCGYLHFNTRKWHSSACSVKRQFVCVADNVLLVKENKTWEEALEHCRAIGSVHSRQHNHYREHQYDLVSLQSEDDHRYARDKVQEASTNEVWTALRFLAGQWLWVDGEPQQYQNLPLCPAWGRHCGTLPKDHSTTQWQIRDCMERRNFLCVKKQP